MNTDIGLGRQGADPRRPVTGCVLSLPSPLAGEVGIVPCDGCRPPRLTPRRVQTEGPAADVPVREE